MANDSNDASQPKYTPGQIYRRLLGYTFAYRSRFLVACLGLVLYAGADSTFMWLMQPLLDGSFVERDPFIIAIMPFCIIGLFVIRGSGSFISSYFMAWVGRRIIKNMRTELFAKLLQMPTRYYDQTPSGILISKLTYNIEQIANSCTSALTVIIRDTLMVIGLLAVMFYMSPKLATFTLVVGPIIALLIAFVSKRFRRISGRIQGSMGDVTHVTAEAIEGHQVVKLFGGQAYEATHFEQVNDRNWRLHMKLALTTAASNPVVQILASFALAGVVYVATHDPAESAMSAGTFVAFMGATIGLMTPLKHLTSVNAELQKGIAAADSIFEILDADSEIDDGKLTLPTCQGAIEFKQVSFAYNAEEAVLHDISLAVQPGQTIALVGHSGSGKSSLVSLIPRFYDLASGQILLDGQDIRQYQLTELRQHIALVSQNVTLFNDTIAKNIAYGVLGDVSADDIEQAAKAANAWEFIQKLPAGLDSSVGEQGSQLSGGQRQRLAIARALLKDAPILILDEATSALDTESERLIQTALEKLMQNRTTFVVAHRLSTIERADKIVVMSDGRIVETGTHLELLSKQGVYANLHRMQFSEPTGQ